MKENILDSLVEANEFPILFIGSGISRRYLKDYPNWDDLLKSFWSQVSSSDDDYYKRLNEIRREIREEEISKNNVQFYVNTRIASIIENKIEDKYYSGEIDISDKTSKEIYEDDVSVFKYLLCKRFSKCEKIDSMKEEIEALAAALIRAQIIITTNYDSFIEKIYNSQSKDKIKKFIGQKGLYGKNFGIAELYKIHGDFEQPNSIIITKEDYEKFEKNSILISAKITTLLLDSPIIFLGYSLTDENVRRILRDLTASLSDKEKEMMSKRIILVEWERGKEDIEETLINDQDLGCSITVIKTDNYKRVYGYLSAIDQGVLPSDIRKFNRVIKRIVVEKGQKGKLKNVLISPENLDVDLERINDSNLAIAIGDNRYLFRLPSMIDYLIDYIEDKKEQNIDNMLRFIGQHSGRFPCRKYLTKENIDGANIYDDEKDKLRDKLDKLEKISEIMKVLGRHEEYSRIEEIQDQHCREYKEYKIVAYNIERIEQEAVKEYILEKLREIKTRRSANVSTALRLLIYTYDLVYY